MATVLHRLPHGIRAPIAIAALLVALAYFVFVLIPYPATAPDFRYIWTAGRVWSEGLNPYGPDFPTELSGWLYPPHWFLIAVPFAAIPYFSSFAVWKILTTSIAIGATVSAWRALATHSRSWSIIATCAWLTYFLTLTAVGGALRSGQPTILSYVGLCLIVAGLASDRRGAIVAGVFLSLLKPTLGLPFAVLLLLSARTVAPAMIGFLLIGAASLPSLLSDGVRSGFLRTVLNLPTQYQAIRYNTPDIMTGFFHFTSRLFGWAPGVPGSGIAAALLAGAVALGVGRKTAREIIVVGILATSFVAMLHSYDLILVALLLPMLGLLRAAGRVIALSGFALLWRPENVARLFHGSEVMTSDTQSVGLMLLFVAYGHGLWRLKFEAVPSTENATRRASL